MAAKMGKTKATHVRSFMVMAKPPDTTDLVRWVLRSLAWLVGILILLASPKDTKNAPEKTFFVLSLRLRLTLCRLSTCTGCRRVLFIAASRRWWRRFRFLAAKKPGQPGSRRRVAGHMPAVQRAEFGWLRAVNVDFLTRDRTRGRGQLQRVGIDGDAHDAFRHQERLNVTVCGQSDRALHKIRPDRRGSIPAGKP